MPKNLTFYLSAIGIAVVVGVALGYGRAKQDIVDHQAYRKNNPPISVPVAADGTDSLTEISATTGETDYALVPEDAERVFVSAGEFREIFKLDVNSIIHGVVCYAFNSPEGWDLVETFYADLEYGVSELTDPVSGDKLEVYSYKSVGTTVADHIRRDRTFGGTAKLVGADITEPKIVQITSDTKSETPYEGYRYGVPGIEVTTFEAFGRIYDLVWRYQPESTGNQENYQYFVDYFNTELASHPYDDEPYAPGFY